MSNVEVLGSLPPEYSLGNRARVWPVVVSGSEPPAAPAFLTTGLCALGRRDRRCDRRRARDGQEGDTGRPTVHLALYTQARRRRSICHPAPPAVIRCRPLAPGRALLQARWAPALLEDSVWRLRPSTPRGARATRGVGAQWVVPLAPRTEDGMERYPAPISPAPGRLRAARGGSPVRMVPAESDPVGKRRLARRPPFSSPAFPLTERESSWRRWSRQPAERGRSASGSTKRANEWKHKRPRATRISIQKQL